MWFWYSTATGGKSRIAVVDVLPPLPLNLIYMFARYSHARVLSRHIFTIISSRAFRRETTAIFKGDKIFRSHLSLRSRPDCSIFLVFPHFSSETRKGSFFAVILAPYRKQEWRNVISLETRDFLFFHWYFWERDESTVASCSSLEKVKKKFKQRFRCPRARHAAATNFSKSLPQRKTKFNDFN